MSDYKWIWEMTLYRKWVLIFLIICNVAGTIYGYDWYSGQLYITPRYFKPFVPDSPTASLFLSLSIMLMLFNKRSAILNALAFVTLIKYGVWAVIMNILMFVEQGEVTINGIMLIVSHGIMAVEAIYFYPRFKVTMTGFLVALIWVLINDIIDYGFGQFPYYDFIASHTFQIGVLSVCLSISALLLYLVLQRFMKVKTFD